MKTELPNLVSAARTIVDWTGGQVQGLADDYDPHDPGSPWQSAALEIALAALSDAIIRHDLVGDGEVEVTSKMKAAGVLALMRHEADDFPASDLVSTIFSEMAAAAKD